MKRKKVVFITLAMIIFLGIGFIALNSYFKAKDYKSLFIKVNNKSDDNTNEAMDLSRYMYDYKEDELGISESELSYINTYLNIGEISQYNELAELDKEDAMEDINFLFNLFKYSYAGYSYFGGDDTFEKAKENIIKSIDDYPKEKITSKELEKIIINNTDFIQDGHFGINNKSSLKKYYYYSNEDISFNKSTEEYYINKDDEKWYIKTINDSDNFEDYLKLSINSEGDLCYHIGILDNLDNPHKINVTLEVRGEEIDTYVELRKNTLEERNSDNNIGYEYTEKMGIPILTIPRMYNANLEDKSIDLFSKSALTLKEKPVIILDIRGNHGGQDIGPLNWFKNFTGEMPQTESESIQLYSLINNYISKLAIKNINYETLSTELKEEYKKEVERANINVNKWCISKTKEKRHENDTKIFVLIDDKVASSAESFIEYLKTLENVILVGTNTSGILLSNAYTTIQLPNSHINISLGNIITAKKGFTEGKGFEPDIWINSGDPLDKVLKLINKNN